MIIRTHIVIDTNIDDKFREKFIRKKGDYSKKIQELMEKELKIKIKKEVKNGRK